VIVAFVAASLGAAADYGWRAVAPVFVLLGLAAIVLN